MQNPLASFRKRKTPENKKGKSILPAHLQPNFVGPDPFSSPRTRATLHLPPEPISPPAVPEKKSKNPKASTSGYKFKTGDTVPAIFLPDRYELEYIQPPGCTSTPPGEQPSNIKRTPSMYGGKLPEGAITVRASSRCLKPGEAIRPSMGNLIREEIHLAAVPGTKQDLVNLHIKAQSAITRKSSKE